jgi:GNAT superfamily N-acetyltransferase
MIRTNSKHPHFISLVKQLDDLLSVVDGDKHDYYHQFNSIEGIPHVLVAYSNEQPVACGAIKPYNDTTVEIKRMYTQPNSRGMDFGKTILQELEQWAKELGYKKLILETGISFEAANRLYKKYGFTQIPNYDQYKDIKDSICFEKVID